MTGMDVTYLGALTAGVLSFLSPCILPLVPPYLAFIGGVSLGQIAGGAGGGRLVHAGGAPREAGAAGTGEMAAARRRVVVAAIAFVLGFGTVFVALGAGASMAGNVISRHTDLLAPVAGMVIIVLGLHFLGVFRLAGLMRDVRVRVSGRPASLLGVYGVGLAFGFGWTPCVGPVLAAILFVAGTAPSPVTGATLLAAYALGIGIPFVLAALAMGPFMALMRRLRRYAGLVEKGIGGLLVLTGVLVLTGGMTRIANWMLKTVPVLGTVG